MIVFRENAIYIQKKDLLQIITVGKSVFPPASIIKKGLGKTGKITDKNKHDFIKLTKPYEKEYIKGIDYILDYDYITSLSPEEYRTLMETVKRDKYDAYRAATKPITEENADEIRERMDQYRYLEYRQQELDDYVNYVSGDIKVKLPRVLRKELKKKNKEFEKRYREMNEIK